MKRLTSFTSSDRRTDPVWKNCLSRGLGSNGTIMYAKLFIFLNDKLKASQAKAFDDEVERVQQTRD